MSDYTDIPINLIGGENRSRSKQWSSSKLVNMIVEQQSTGRSPVAALCWPGETKFDDFSDSTRKSRALFFHNEVMHQLVGNELFQVFGDGARSSLATIPGSDRVSVASDGTYILIRLKGGVIYQNNRFVLAGAGATYEVFESQVREVFIPPTLDDYSVAPSSIEDSPAGGQRVAIRVQDIEKADRIINQVLQVVSFQKKIYVAGTKSVQVFYLDASETNPLKSLEQASSDKIGVDQENTMASTPTNLYLLGNDSCIWRTGSSQFENITPPSIGSQLRLADKSGAYAFTMSMDGQQFYVLQLYSAGITLVYSETTGQFSRIQTGLISGPHLVSNYLFAYGKHFITDENSADLLYWDHLNFTSNGSPIVRQIDTSPINGKALEIYADSLIFGYMDIKLEVGVGNSSDPDPEMEVQYSNDGGLTFKNAQPIKLQRLGQSSAYRARWNDCFHFYDMVVRLKVTASVFISWHDASIGIQKGGY